MGTLNIFLIESIKYLFTTMKISIWIQLKLQGQNFMNFK